MLAIYGSFFTLFVVMLGSLQQSHPAKAKVPNK